MLTARDPPTFRREGPPDGLAPDGLATALALPLTLAPFADVLVALGDDLLSPATRGKSAASLLVPDACHRCDWHRVGQFDAETMRTMLGYVLGMRSRIVQTEDVRGLYGYADERACALVYWLVVPAGNLYGLVYELV